MPVPVEPYIVIQTAEVKGTITTGQTFSWYNSATSGACTISGVSGWCTMPNGTIQAGLSQQATATGAPGSYGFSCPCCNVPSPIIVVHPVHMEKIA